MEESQETNVITKAIPAKPPMGLFYQLCSEGLSYQVFFLTAILVIPDFYSTDLRLR